MPLLGRWYLWRACSEHEEAVKLNLQEGLKRNEPQFKMHKKV